MKMKVEGWFVARRKVWRRCYKLEDQGNDADRDTNANLEGRDDVKTYVVLPQDINAKLTPLLDIHVTVIAEPSFFAPTNRPPTPTPLFIQLQKPPILTPATTPSSSLQNLPDFGLTPKGSFTKALVDIAYEADKFLLSANTLWRYDRGSKRRRPGKEPESTSAPREKTTTTARKTTTGSKTHKQSASQSAPVEETMQSTNVL
ncbi:hypothetical protein Tco_0483775 [Tanacetum coccineum]